MEKSNLRKRKNKEMKRNEQEKHHRKTMAIGNIH